MRPGSWAQLDTVGLPAVMIPPIGSGSILEYTDRIVWDPLHTRMVVMGGAHTGNTKYSIEWQDDQWGWYDAGTNTWVAQSPSKATCTASSTADGCNNALPQFRISHSYEHMTVDTSTGDIYYRLYFSPQVMKWTYSTQTWSALPIIPPAIQGYMQVAGALVYFPERESLVFVNAGDSHNFTTNEDYIGIYEYRIASRKWAKIKGGTFLTNTKYQNVAVYGPACHCVLFSGSDTLYTYNQDGSFTTKKKSAVPLRVAHGGSSSINTVDPVTGVFLIWDSEGTGWQYDSGTDVWAKTGVSTPGAVIPVTGDGSGTDEVAAGPVSQYGVVMFVRFVSNHPSGVSYLYKHTNGAQSVAPAAANSPTVVPKSEPTPAAPPKEATAPRESAQPSEQRPLFSYQARCSAPAVIRCVGFDSQEEITGKWGENHGILSGAATPALDTTIKASGNGSIKFTIPSNSGADTSGSYFTNFSSDLSAQFGENSEFYIQWRQRFSTEFLNTIYEGGEGWKQAIIGTGDRPGRITSSCTETEVVIQNAYQRGFAQMYNSCTGSNSHGSYDPFQQRFGAYDFKLQNARSGSACLYSQGKTNPPSFFPPKGNCFGYFPNEWMTFQVHIKTGPRVKNEFTNSFVELWIAREGRPSEPVIKWGPYNLSAGAPEEPQQFGKIWLLPYDTNKNSKQVTPTAFTWYDELIISRERIPDPK